MILLIYEYCIPNINIECKYTNAYRGMYFSFNMILIIIFAYKYIKFYY